MTCRTFTIPALTGGTVTIVDPSNNQYWAFTYWGDSYWGDSYWGAVAGSITSTTPDERIFTVSAEDRTYTVTPDNSDGVVVVSNDIVVSGAGTSAVNRTYSIEGTYNGKPYYGVGDDTLIIYWITVPFQGLCWTIYDIFGLPIFAYYSNEDVATPDLVTTWVALGGGLPVPTVTSASSITTPASRTYTIPECED
jgi:hypothetical protein